MDRKERAKEIASLPDYGVLAIADYVESEIAKVQKKLDEARYISTSVISEAERKARVEVALEIITYSNPDSMTGSSVAGEMLHKCNQIIEQNKGDGKSG